jgi:hypothetical protein
MTTRQQSYMGTSKGAIIPVTEIVDRLQFDYVIFLIFSTFEVCEVWSKDLTSHRLVLLFCIVTVSRFLICQHSMLLEKNDFGFAERSRWRSECMYTVLRKM